MKQITLELDNQLAEKWKEIVGFFGDDNQLIISVIDYHRKKLRRTIARLQLDLEKYEKTYNMSSLDFYQRFDAGEMDDSKDFMLWAGVYELWLNRQDKLKQLS